MNDLIVLTYIATTGAIRRGLRRLHIDEGGEGVISAAIAVLIMAFLGAAMWIAFDRMFTNAADNTEDQIDQIGR